MALLDKFERDVSFFSVLSSDWDDPTETRINVRGLVSVGSNSLDGAVAEGLSSSSIRVFLKKSYKDQVNAIKIEDQILFEGERYAVTKVDVRGVLPGAHKIRFEGVLKR